MNTIRTTGGKRFSLQWMTGTAMMIAVTLVLGSTPLGLIRTPILTATTLHIPVIIATLVLGLEAGVITGLVFGAQSFFNSFTSASFFGPFFMNPLVSVLPRMLFPCCVYGIAALAGRMAGKRPWKDAAAYMAASLLGTALHTAMVMGMIYLLYAPKIADMLIAGVGVPEEFASGSVGMGVIAMALGNALPEMVVAAVIAPSVALALKRALGKMRAGR